MNKNELALILKNMYDNAEQGEKVAMIHLFGMKYSKEIKELSSANEIVQLAGINDSYYSEVSKGIKLQEVSNKLLKSNTNLLDLKTKNIMLYGAPGVGKTHNYKRLITMIENGESEKTIFDTISKNETTNNFDNSIFETIKNEKRIEFVTFHQSYSYEDFIEGFRPNENGDIELDKKGGVFKRIADKARENLEESQKEKIQVKEEITFRQKLDSFIEKIEIEIEKKGYYEITDAAYISSIDSDAFRYNIRKENPTYKYDLRMKFEDLFEFEKKKFLQDKM